MSWGELTGLMSRTMLCGWHLLGAVGALNMAFARAADEARPRIAEVEAAVADAYMEAGRLFELLAEVVGLACS